ncbi:MAG: type I-E CRISPR-associated protein Cas6/Cse3/CasE, partial [Methylococcales bacterium]|nr:type I-E CRISPR-associated protein Cas6/Cse3/CasE [Methylococcales bacterium]
MYLSRVTILAEQPEKLAEILQADHYKLHQTLWRLFPDRDKNDKRHFLFKRDDSEYFPLFYVLSTEPPHSLENILKVETKEFKPKLQQGDKLAFTLRANPVIKMPNKKARHDVVM